MGNARPKPKRLAEKLQQIRLALDLSQPEMLRRLGLEDIIQYARISEYETGIREPSLMTLLQYARVAGVHMEVLVDDELDLPERLPGPTNHEEIKRNFKSSRKIKR
ncbi:MAG TPA: helix-turn-helix transcriptional regulator [Pyrinomonadaceae bacterium]|jgi:transcriptional regulator with XRE-family HTH domain|nr:helix-turn-helix transcriptional regulator [Pyrinomonadaceae bacterium]